MKFHYLRRKIALMMVPFFFLLLLADHIAFAEPQLRQIQIISRHGARYPLWKDSNNNNGEIHSGLTPIGIYQSFRLGEWMANEYRNILNNNVPLRMESSALERTLVSANAIGAGLSQSLYSDSDNADNNLLPSNVTTISRIPIYSRPLEDDVQIRAYDKCEALHTQLKDLYETNAEWLALEYENREFLQHLGSLDNFQAWAVPTGTDGNFRIRLQDLWNVYDTIHVAKTECEGPTTTTCSAVPDPMVRGVVTEDEFAQLEQLAHRAEFLKYGSPKEGDKARWIGYNLLGTILDRMEDYDEYKMVWYSAHYPTMVGVLAALGWTNDNDDSLPDYAAALILEYYHDEVTNSGYFQVKYKRGDHVDTTDKLVVCPNGVCLREDFEAVHLWTTEDWCNECGAHSTQVCRIFTDSPTSQQPGPSSPTTTTNNSEDPEAVVAPTSTSSCQSLENPVWVGVAIGFSLALLSFLIPAVWVCKKRRENHRLTLHENSRKDLDLTAIDDEEEYGGPSRIMA